MRFPVLCAALIVLCTAGCGSSATPDPAASEDRQTQAVKYSQCMRENGVPSFPDPVDGRIQLRIEPGSDLDPEGEPFKKAQQACKDLEPAGLGNAGQNGEQQGRVLKWVACMRQNGVPNMPDPQADGKMLVGPDTGVDPESPAYKDAETKCRDLAPGGLG
ncbi:hypothetical protein [Paractinoplanes toevensis]|uniref:Secreted protein n=1 Tax=Paractinoplanes toevensis TaxID=571911 RepID=A0A919W3A8_9ACTN|nr:hypothetical protein [Actinoplanes toevensis]GIM90335.1 hypothetical protein Ato02nite_021280 [Actinoplanes toevensis]